MKRLLLYTALCCLLLAAGSGMAQSKTAYYCPPSNNACDTLAFASAGRCPHCGMELLKQTNEEHMNTITKRLKIAFYLQDGVEVLDFAGPMEVFNYANFEIFTVSKTKGPITSQGVLKILPDYTLDNAPAADILAFFGGNAGNAVNDPDVISWINRQSNVMHYFSVAPVHLSWVRQGSWMARPLPLFMKA